MKQKVKLLRICTKPSLRTINRECMAKRFTDTEKWNKKFIRNLKPNHKLLWFFILDECNTAGIWEVDIEVAQLKTGIRINKIEAVKALGDKIIEIDGGNKWFVPAFIEFQYGTLSETNRAHAKAIFLLKRFDLLTNDLFVKKPLVQVPKGAMVVVKEEEEVKEEEMEEVKEAPVLKNLPWPTVEFFTAWQEWKEYKKTQHRFSFKSEKTEGYALVDLVKISKNTEATAIQIIKKSMSKGWAGLFEIKTENKNGNNQTPTGTVLGDSNKTFGKL